MWLKRWAEGRMDRNGDVYMRRLKDTRARIPRISLVQIRCAGYHSQGSDK